MADGNTAQDALNQLLADDEGREKRQVGLVDRQGTAVAIKDNASWCIRLQFSRLVFRGQRSQFRTSPLLNPPYAVQEQRQNDDDENAHKAQPAPQTNILIFLDL